MISWVGAKTWLPVLTMAWGVIAAAQAAVKEEKALIALRFFLGAAEAGEPALPASVPLTKYSPYLVVSSGGRALLIHAEPLYVRL